MVRPHRRDGLPLLQKIVTKRQLRIQPHKRGPLHPTLPRATAVRPNCSSLRSIAKHYVSAHETLAALESAIRQWSAENDSISGAFPVIDVRNLAGLQIQTAVLDLRSLIAEGDPLPSTLPDDADDGSDPAIESRPDRATGAESNGEKDAM